MFYRDTTRTQPVLIERIPATVMGREPLDMLKDVELITEAFDKATIYIPEWSSSEQY